MPGETLVPLPDEVIPKHFTQEYVPPPPKPEAAKPIPLSKITEEMGKESAKTVEIQNKEPKVGWNKERSEIAKRKRGKKS